MFELHAPDARPLENATKALESAQADVQTSSDANTCRAQVSVGVEDAKPQMEIHASTGSSIVALAHSLYQALDDHMTTDPTHLPFRKDDLIECLGMIQGDSFRGRIYSGKPEERVGIYPGKLVNKVDPTDPAFHDALATIEAKHHAGLNPPDESNNVLLGQGNASREKHSIGVSTELERENPVDLKRHASEKFDGLDEILREKPLDGINTPPEEEVLCLAYARGVCREGDRCRFSHNLNTAHPRVCQKLLAGACTDSACTLLHIRLPNMEDQEEEKVLPDVPKTKSAPPKDHPLVTEPFLLGSIARQDSDIQPALLLPGSDNIPEEFSTIEGLLKNNPNYGAKTRDFIPSRSVPLQQLRENRQRTPPLPSQSSKTGIDTKDDLADIQTRCRQLRSQLFDAGKADLFYTLTRSQDSTQPKTAVLSIAALQHMALHQLQYDISCYVGLMYRTSQFYMELQGFPPLVDLMNDYCTTVRNLDYMKQCATRGYEDDPFLMKSSRALERNILETTKLIPNHVLPSGVLPLPKDDHSPQLRDMGRNEANQAAYQKKRLLRFTMAGLGGLLLVVPMLIMANVPGKTASLVTTCVALLIFSALIPFLTELSPNEILATTAAYAAVLVVFVGTSLSTSTVVITPTNSVAG